MTTIGFGTWSWGNKFLWGYLPDRDDEILEKTFNEALKGGLTLIDTADSYGTGKLNGRSEELLGKFLKKVPVNQRKKLTIATKLAPYPWRLGRKGFKKAFEASRSRLEGNLDRVQLHWSTSRYAQWQEIQLIDGLGDLVETGLISEIGLSNMGPKRLRFIYDRLKKRGLSIKSLQIQFSLLSPEPIKQLKIQELCKELNIDLLAYSPLALGVLAIEPNRTKSPPTFIRKEIFKNLLPSSKDLRTKLNSIAKDREVSQSQVALNWCRASGAIPIPGIRSPFQAKDVARALKWDLSKEETQELNLLSKDCPIRMPNNPFISE